MATRQPRVEEYMSSPVETVPAQRPLAEAAAQMRAEDINALVVPGDPYAIVTSTDVTAAVAEGRDPAELTVGDVATEEVETAEPDQFLQEVAAVMLQAGISHLPVVEDGELIGMLSKTDIAASRSE
jgi:CBS domain-containing protein